MNFVLIVLTFLIFACDCSSENEEKKTEKASISYEKKLSVASLEMPNKQLKEASFQGLKTINVEWVSVIPYAFTRKSSYELVYNYIHQR